jgi:hypothetical protein
VSYLAERERERERYAHSEIYKVAKLRVHCEISGSHGVVFEDERFFPENVV